MTENHGRQRLTLFQKFLDMTTKPTEPEDDKRKLPHTIDEILAMEDKVGEILAEITALRKKMQSNKVATVALMSGTFEFRLPQLLKMAKKFNSELDGQLIDSSVGRAVEHIQDAKRGNQNRRS